MYNVIGKDVIRVDGYEKVTGKAIYGDDIKIPGLLYAAVRYTDFPSAKIKKIDISKALKIEKLKKIILHDDIPGIKQLGHIRYDQYILINDTSYYSGDAIAVVAAETQEAANKAADLIEVEYEPLQGIFDVEEALKPSSRLIHPEYKSNIVVHYPLRKGNIEKGFLGSDHVIERTYKTGFHEHAYIEPESLTAVPDPTCRGFKIYGSIQNPFTTRKLVAKAMALKLNQINVISSNLGGSFGGKDDTVSAMACRVAILAKLTDKPVKLTLSRENSVKESHKRHPYIIKHKVGFNNDGKINSMKIDILADSGAYSAMSFFVTWRSVVQAAGPYEIPNVETDIRAVYTNNSYTGAFRGFGSPQVIFAQESLMDEIADICKISPYEIRINNGYKQGSITASGQKLTRHKVSLKEVIDKAITGSDYKNKLETYNKLNKNSDRFKYGIGMACSFRGCALGAEGIDATSAIISVQIDGSVYVSSGLNENGQGMRTTFAQLASEILGAKYGEVHFFEPQTATINDGGPTVASRGTLMGGNAVIMAAEKIKKRIFEIIKTELKADSIEDLTWNDGCIKNNKNNIKISLADACFQSHWKGINLSAYGWYKAPDVSWDEETGQGDAYFTYVYGCQIADIRIDTHTGKIIVNKVTASHDVGRAINKLGLEGQIYGGVTQGMGYGIWEHYNIQNGDVKSENFDEYIVPTIKDVNCIEPIIIENPDIDGPLGAKSIGEPTLELGAAAINNAFTFATNKRSYEIPLTLEKVFLDKQLIKPSRASEANVSTKFKKQTARISNVISVVPKTIVEALKFKNKDDYVILAGGTDVSIQLRKETKPVKLLCIDYLQELQGIELTDNEIIIGGGVKISELIDNKDVKQYFPALVEALCTIGSKQIRNRASLAGNIVNAAPCADSLPPLIAYDAEVILQSEKEIRIISISEFITGTYKTALKKNEILTKITIPIPIVDYKYSYFQLGRRGALNITRISALSLVHFNENKEVEDIKIVHGSLFSKPENLTEIENIFIGKKLTRELIDSIDKPLAKIIEKQIGSRWSSEYKKPVFINMCKDSLLKFVKSDC